MVDRASIRCEETHCVTTAVAEHVGCVYAQETVWANARSSAEREWHRSGVFDIVEAPALKRNRGVAEIDKLDPFGVIRSGYGSDLVETNQWSSVRGQSGRALLRMQSED